MVTLTTGSPCLFSKHISSGIPWVSADASFMSALVCRRQICEETGHLVMLEKCSKDVLSIKT